MGARKRRKNISKQLWDKVNSLTKPFRRKRNQKRALSALANFSIMALCACVSLVLLPVYLPVILLWIGCVYIMDYTMNSLDSGINTRDLDGPTIAPIGCFAFPALLLSIYILYKESELLNYLMGIYTDIQISPILIFALLILLVYPYLMCFGMVVGPYLPNEKKKK